MFREGGSRTAPYIVPAPAGRLENEVVEAWVAGDDGVVAALASPGII
jgi:hypothetical protein